MEDGRGGPLPDRLRAEHDRGALDPDLLLAGPPLPRSSGRPCDRSGRSGAGRAREPVRGRDPVDAGDRAHGLPLAAERVRRSAARVLRARVPVLVGSVLLRRRSASRPIATRRPPRVRASSPPASGCSRARSRELLARRRQPGAGARAGPVVAARARARSCPRRLPGPRSTRSTPARGSSRWRWPSRSCRSSPRACSRSSTPGPTRLASRDRGLIPALAARVRADVAHPRASPRRRHDGGRIGPGRLRRARRR